MSGAERNQDGGRPKDVAARFLSALWPDGIPRGLCVPLWRFPSRLTDWNATPDNLGDLAEGSVFFHAAAHDPEARHRGGATARQRGTRDSARLVPALWTDIDTADGAHSAKDLPERTDVYAQLDAMDPRPSVVIDSGGGVHAYWLLDEPVDITNAKDLGSVLHVLRALPRHFRGDPAVADVARVMRLPGSLNRKSDPPRPVRITQLRLDSRYTLEELERWAESVQASERERESLSKVADADADRAADQCAWFAHTRDDAANLPEPEWHAALSVVARCKNGADLAHKWSRSHPGYSFESTAAKLRHALDRAGPRTCEWIEANGGADYCAKCPHRGRITSPIQLGRPNRDEAIREAALAAVEKALGSDDAFAALHDAEVLGAFRWLRAHAGGDYAVFRAKVKSVEGLHIGPWEDGVKVADSRDFALRHGGPKNRATNTVSVVPGKLAEAVEQTGRILAEVDPVRPVIYQRDGVVVHVAPTPGEAMPRIVVASSPWLRTEASRHIEFIRESDDEDICIDMPHSVAASLLEDTGRWSFAVIEGVISAPTLREDGTLLAADGYDPGTRLLLDTGGSKFPSIPEAPDRNAALEALERVCSVFDEVAFADKLARSVAISAMLTAVSRKAFPQAPLFHINASAMGVGKTTLARAIGIVATGAEVAVTSPGAINKEEEAKKAIMAILLSGGPVAIIDNVEGELRSPTLASVLTSPVFTDRVLGTAHVARLNTRTLWISTGNNVAIAADLVSRTLVCRLYRSEEFPEEHVYHGDLLRAVREARPQLVCDLLTISRAYTAAGSPSLDVPACRMPEWSRLCRAPLIWLRLPDPMEAQRSLRDNDPDRELVSGLLAALRAVFGSVWFRSADVLKRQSGTPDDLQTIRDVLGELCGARGEEPPTTVRVGKALHQLLGRRMGGLVLETRPLQRGCREWRVVEDAPASPAVHGRPEEPHHLHHGDGLSGGGGGGGGGANPDRRAGEEGYVFRTGRDLEAWEAAEEAREERRAIREADGLEPDPSFPDSEGGVV